MCGIAALWLRESVPHNINDIVHTMFKWSEKRGVDGTGLMICSRDRDQYEQYEITKEIKSIENYSSIDPQIISKYLLNDLKIDDIILMTCRAAPETEPSTTEKNMQPIFNLQNQLILIHNGAVSQKLVNYEKTNNDLFRFNTNIDSEAILAVYSRMNKDIKSAQEYLSGGFAYVMLDLMKNKMYVVNDFKPLATGYIKGLGYMVASDNNCLNEVVQMVTDCPRTGMNVWEYYYNNPQQGPLIRSIDLDSGFEQHIKFRPRYITNNWDSSTKPIDEELCLVSCSGGLDSSLTLAILKYSGYQNIIACHFNYGHRGSDAEQCAIEKVCNNLDIPLKIFDTSKLYEQFEVKSMLTDNDADIITGTELGLKTVAAWVPGRNMLFSTILAAYAESLVLKHNYKEVYIVGGWLQLTESGTYPDNSEDFLRSFLSFCKYGTLIGDRIKPLYCLANIMKSEQWLLIKSLKLEKIIADTISCDRPQYDMLSNTAYNCSSNGMPACGSGLLSWWGSKMVGLDDMKIRNFYEIDQFYDPYIPDHLEKGIKQNININDIINRILIPENRLDQLKKIINK